MGERGKSTSLKNKGENRTADLPYRTLYIGQQLKEAREAYQKRKGVRKSARSAMEDLLPLFPKGFGQFKTRGRLAQYENNYNPTPFWFAEIAERLYNPENKWTKLYYNDGEQQAADAALKPLGDVLIQPTAEMVTVLIGGSSRPWDVSSSGPLTMILGVSLGKARIFVEMEEPISPLRPGQVAIFFPNRHNKPGKWQLYRSKKNSSEHVIRYEDDNQPDTLRGPTGATPLPLADYSRLGYMMGIAWGDGAQLDNFLQVVGGIGPRSVFEFSP